ncbi:MAG: hypothetical protein MPW14_04815 [Candidatus Manganitrophus sp.]|nr:hypothetical protein [Candidatus Manganitrophus sp.]MDC4223360.1 hypothetical protein [Candidatus Manganitrophus sp.]WDT71559.1 MAG: hypothetical protein MPW17_01540 [Candidatus Manganitrophus sp.]WDT81107.1 MAG: hypothetical protein MPW14_04815 [Candidatus Manganitrophus sp.]
MKVNFYGRCFLLVIPVLFLLSCESGPEVAPHADWADVTLHAVGIGQIQGEWSLSDRIQAVQHAKVDAYAKLESQIMMLQIDSKKTISELVAKDEQIGKKIASFVRGARIVRTDNRENGVEILTELFLGENFKATIGLAERKPKPVPRGNTPESSRF